MTGDMHSKNRLTRLLEWNCMSMATTCQTQAELRLWIRTKHARCEKTIADPTNPSREGIGSADSDLLWQETCTDVKLHVCPVYMSS